MRRSLAAGNSHQQHWMHAACGEAPPPAGPASNTGCKHHALMPRRRQLLPKTMDASDMRRSLAAGSSYQQHGMQAPCRPCRRKLLPKQWMQAACIKASPSAAPARNTGRKRHASKTRRRQLLPETIDGNGLRRNLTAGSSCQKQWMQTACDDASTPWLLPATPDASGTTDGHVKAGLVGQGSGRVGPGSAGPASGRVGTGQASGRDASKPRRRQPLPETRDANGMR